MCSVDALRFPVVTTVPSTFGNVMVRSAVGSVTVRVVSKSSGVAPSRTMDAPETLIRGVVREVVTVTSLGNPTVTAAVSEPDPETSTSLAVPATVAT